MKLGKFDGRLACLVVLTMLSGQVLAFTDDTAGTGGAVGVAEAAEHPASELAEQAIAEEEQASEVTDTDENAAESHSEANSGGPAGDTE